jgi:hypothetical protein
VDFSLVHARIIQAGISASYITVHGCGAMYLPRYFTVVNISGLETSLSGILLYSVCLFF